MHFEPHAVYHLYNRGNQKQKLFFSRDNYLFFLRKARSEWLLYCDILSYCLMPNHFHFIVAANEKGCENITLKGKETHLQNLSKAIGKTLSSYTIALNLEQQRTGNLFQKKTKAKLLDTRFAAGSYLANCVYYVHNNPFLANLVKDAGEWEFSSLKDYAGLRNGTLCNKALLCKLTGMGEEDFTYCKVVDDNVISCFFE
jgi:putative transposase